MRKHLTEKEFDQIKILQNAGLSTALTAKATGRSYPLINVVFKYNTFEDYKTRNKSKKITVVDKDEEIKQMIFNLTNQVIAMNKKLDEALQEKAPF